MWLSGLHMPETYLAALVQTACRAKGWPLDKSSLYTKVTSYRSPEDVPDSAKPELGCFVTGLHLEGASWDFQKNELKRQEPKELITELPVVQIVPVEQSKLKLHNTLRTPVYVTQSRRDAMGNGLVFEADLPTSQHTSHWILQGAAIVLNTS